MLAADQQILRGVSATLSWQNLDEDGDAAAPAGAVTVEVVRDDGTELVAAGTATTGSGTDPRTYTLSAANNTLLDLLTVTWTDTGDSSTHTTYVEVVGGYYFTVTEARASDTTLTDTTKYPSSAIAAARREVEEEFENICELAFVPRYAKETISGTGRSSLTLAHPEVTAVRSVRAYSDADTYTAWTADELAALIPDPSGVVKTRTGIPFASGARNIVVAYEHGLPRPPAEVKRAALQRLRYRLNMARNAIPDRATSFSVAEGGTYSLDTAGAHKTGQPDIDAVLARHRRPTIGAA